jgi:hypothetical protein
METRPKDTARRATELLGLAEEPYRLFHSDSWPEHDLDEKFELSEDPKERAEIVAKVIDDFIAKHK